LTAHYIHARFIPLGILQEAITEYAVIYWNAQSIF